MAQIVYDETQAAAHILVGVSPRASTSLCGARAVRFADRIAPFDHAGWPRLAVSWCNGCLAIFDPELVGAS
jgi:peroxiredoxin